MSGTKCHKCELKSQLLSPPKTAKFALVSKTRRNQNGFEGFLFFFFFLLPPGMVSRMIWLLERELEGS